MQPVAAKIDRTEKGPSTRLPSASMQKVETTRLAGFAQQNSHHLFSNNINSSGNRDDGGGRMRKSVSTQKKKSSLLSGVTGKSSDDEETGPMITKEMLKTKAYKVAMMTMMVGGQSGKE